MLGRSATKLFIKSKCGFVIRNFVVEKNQRKKIAVHRRVSNSISCGAKLNNVSRRQPKLFVFEPEGFVPNDDTLLPMDSDSFAVCLCTLQFAC
jgi:hypothetical protein